MNGAPVLFTVMQFMLHTHVVKLGFHCSLFPYEKEEQHATVDSNTLESSELGCGAYTCHVAG